MAKRVPKPTRLQVKKSMESLVERLEKAYSPPNDVDDGTMHDPSIGKVNKAISNLQGKIAEQGVIDSQEINENAREDANVEKADLKNIAGTGGGAALGSLVGGAPGAAIGGIAGNALTKPKPPAPPAAPTAKAILKCQAELRLKKAITLVEGYSPMTYIDLVKAFGSTESIPDIMKEEILRPPTQWFETAIMKASEITDQPFTYAVKMWYGKGVGPALGAAAGSEAIAHPEKIGTAVEGVGKVGPAMSSVSEGARESFNPIGNAAYHKVKQDLNMEKSEPVRKLIGGALLGGGIGSLVGHPLAGAAIGAGGEEVGGKIMNSEDGNVMAGQNIHKLIGGGLLGAGIGSLLGHPLAGAAIGAGGEEMGSKLLGKSLDNIKKSGDLENLDADRIGNAVLEAIQEIMEEDTEIHKEDGGDVTNFVNMVKSMCSDGSSVSQKSVAEPISSKFSPKERKPKFDNGGESEVSSDGTKINVNDLADKSKTAKTA
jgi:hypothetical protein